eukprot:9719276-Heterocapsa_arctica.AAC.1
MISKEKSSYTFSVEQETETNGEEQDKLRYSLIWKILKVRCTAMGYHVSSMSLIAMTNNTNTL